MAKVLQNQYYIMKIPSDKIGSLTKYTYKDAIRDSNIVSIGDNLVLAKIRELHGINDDHIALYEKVQLIRKEMKKIKKRSASKKNAELIHKLQEQLDELLFVPEIINIKVVQKKDYKTIGRYGFDLNGKHYVRFCCGSGQMRRNTITFIDKKIYPIMMEKLMCGLQGKLSSINLAKLSAYFALSFSSVLWVREPRVCVIKDFETVIKNQKVNFICDDNKIEQRFKDMKLNSADGQGLISPEMAYLWSLDMHLDYVPCSFVVRTAFIKGNLVPFDFKSYARENGISTITDRYGQTYNIDDIDVLISESQFKMVRYYSSWEDYLYYHHLYNLKWGVARYNKKFDDEYVLTNYQYIQVLDLTPEDVKGLVSYTTDWINKICSGNKLYAILYNLGVRSGEEDLKEVYSSCGSIFTKAIAKNSFMLQDGYVQKKIRNAIKESIRQAKIGRIWVKGNYEFMISDPVAQCRSALGLSPDGLIPANHVYSNFWNTRTDSHEVVCCRSPLTHYGEVNPLNLYHDNTAAKWYRYIYSGIIYSIYDVSVCRHADSDFDGDIVFSTDNEYFLKGVRRSEAPIIYEKGKVPNQKITLPNQVKCDLRGLDTKVGQITNYSTSMIAMLPLFKNDKQKDQREEIERRLKLLRRCQGDEIDRIKGIKAMPLPKEWKHWEKINVEDTDIVKAEKYKRNSMVVKKKPYFFIYLYDHLQRDYKEYVKNYNKLSSQLFGCKIKDLLFKQNKTEEEMTVVRKYQKYSPVLETNCVMNNLCKAIESVSFDIYYKKSPNDSLLPHFIETPESYSYDDSLLHNITSVYRRYKYSRTIKGRQFLLSDDAEQSEDIAKGIHEGVTHITEECRNDLYGICNNSEQLLYHMMYLAGASVINYDFIWEIMGDDLLDFIPVKEPLVPIVARCGLEYLGTEYSLQEVEDVSI